MNSLVSYLKNVRGEFAHIVWPSQRQAVMHVVLIILISAFATLFIGGLDYLLTHAVGKLVGAQ